MQAIEYIFNFIPFCTDNKASECHQSGYSKQKHYHVVKVSHVALPVFLNPGLTKSSNALALKKAKSVIANKEALKRVQ
jgi:hypothetical protein